MKKTISGIFDCHIINKYTNFLMLNISFEMNLTLIFVFNYCQNFNVKKLDIQIPNIITASIYYSKNMLLCAQGKFT